MSTRFALPVFLSIFLGGSALADPLRPGGALTHDDLSKNAFSHPGPNIKGQLNNDFFVGNSLFKKPWVEAPASTEMRDGLGPTFNATACASCHILDGRGVGYLVNGGKDIVNRSLLFRLSQRTASGIEDHPDYGGQLNHDSIPGVPVEAQPEVVFEYIKGQYADGTPYELRRPIFTFKNFQFQPFDSNSMISPRVAPQVMGLGLVDALSEAAILTNADEFDSNGDGISGRANYIYDIEKQTLAIGRFGWKASQPSIRQQTAGALLGDMGITTTIFPKQNCPLVQIACGLAVSGGEPEAPPEVLHVMEMYGLTLGVPARRGAGSVEVVAGEKIFHQIGCASCHTPSHETSSDYFLEPLRSQKFYPYSDFLLHDMGEELADNRPDGLATGVEWRTPPLWGVGLFQKVSKHQNLLHDARARGVDEAILWHGGEARAARDEFKKLISSDRKNLVSFINSL